MRKLFIIFAGTLISGSLLAGGLVTNTNQSALFTRLQNRNASTGIDAVYFNPAGLTKLGDGFFASINNQTIGQTKTVTTTFPWIAGAPKDYVGNVSAPVYPGVYAAYNTGKFSFSAGFNPIGGGGGATYDKGLPSFEMPISAIPAGLTSSGIPTTGYQADIFFEGSSVYFGVQANVAYKINDQLSVAAGVRVVSAKNTYNGHIRSIMINPNYPAFGAIYTGVMNPASDFFTAGATTLNTLSASATALATGLAAVPAATPLTSLPEPTRTQVLTVLGAANVNTTGMTVGVAIPTLNAAAPQFTAKANAMTTNANATKDVEVDAEQKGLAYTPIFSVNYSPSDKVNLSVRYEMKTSLELTTTLIDNKGGGIFVDGDKSPASMPSLLALGAEIKPLDNLSIAASFNTYADKKVDYDGSYSKDILQIDKNFLEYGLGAEYGINDKLRVSAGWVATKTGVLPAYQSDQRYSTNTNSFGGGFGYRITPMIDLNIGGQYTFYAEDSQTLYYPKVSAPLFDYSQTYNKQTWVIAVGVDLYFGKSE